MKKRPDKTERTKSELQEAFWRLYVKQPMESITVQDICGTAGYTRGTFYSHYHDRYEVLESIESQLLEGSTDCVERCMKRLSADSSKLSCLAALAEVVAFYERNKERITVLLGGVEGGNGGDPAFVLRLKERLKPLWRVYVLSGGEGSELSEGEIELVLEYALSGSLFMLGRWLQNPGNVSAARIGHLIYDFAIKSVRNV